MRNHGYSELRIVRSATFFSLLALACAACWAQTAETPKQPGLGDMGSIYVSDARGIVVKVADAGHCSASSGVPDQETMVCLVTRLNEEQVYLPSSQIEIYLKGARKIVLTPGGPIREWQFWNNYEQVAVAFDKEEHLVSHALYDVSTGRLVDKVDDPEDKSQLPQWAKSRIQVEDESVKVSEGLTRDRNAWIDKTMRQIATIHPGMKRSELAALFRPDGGLSTQTEERYLFKECQVIKIDVHFKPAKSEGEWKFEDPDDVIESISKPYLQYPIYD